MTPAARPPLSRAAIVDAAIGFVDENGLPALTMRQLGQLLGVEAMSIYHHVNGREDLLEAVVSRLMETVEIPPPDSLKPVDGWQGFLQHVAHSIRSVAVEHPNLFPLVSTKPPAAPWLRPPLRSLEVVDTFLAGLLARGLPEEQAVHVYKVFTSFLLGHLLLEVAQTAAHTGHPDEPLDEGGATVPNRDQQQRLTSFPTVVRLEDRLRRHDPDVEFERALEALLDHLDADLSQ